MRLYFIALNLIFFGCGYEAKLPGAHFFGSSDDDGYQSACNQQSPELEAEISALTANNDARREQAIADEQMRLGVTSVQFFQYLKDDPDPFPDAIPVGKNANDVRKYAVFHGFDGNDTIYETFSGSHQYFIVDHASGDGFGLNKVSMYFGEKFFPSKLAFHSWQVSPENVLVRAEQAPDTQVIRQEPICGCGLNQIETENGDAASKKSAIPGYPAIFLLPGTDEPKIGEEPFNAKYLNEIIDLKYVPKKGHRCAQDYIVC